MDNLSKEHPDNTLYQELLQSMRHAILESKPTQQQAAPLPQPLSELLAQQIAFSAIFSTPSLDGAK